VADIETGETLRLVASRGRPKHGEPFTMWFAGVMTAFTGSAAGRSLTSVQWQVWAWVCSAMGFDNELSLNVTHLASGLGRPRPVVSRAVTALEKAGLVRREPDPRDPSRTVLSVNAHLVYRGTVQGRRDAVLRQTWAPSGAQFASMS
jgi:DNA-binding transcriptional ArsR family regulator